MPKTSFFAAAVLALAVTLRAGETELTIPETKAPPKIDGVLSDPCWKSAGEIDTLHCYFGGTEDTKAHKIFVTRDNQWLYVGFRVAQPAYNRNDAKCLKHDDVVQREDNVQVSFDPGTDGKLYYQFLLNKANTRADFRMTTEGRDRDGWNIPWRSAVTEDKDGWTAEMALPFSLIALQGDPGKAKMNFLVENFIQLRDQCQVKIGQDIRKYSWVKLYQQFHEPERFKGVSGLAGAPFSAPFLPFAAAPSVAPYYEKDGKTFFDVNVPLEVLSGVAGNVRVEVLDKTVDGKEQAVAKAFALKGGEKTVAVVAVPAGGFAKRDLTVFLEDPASGERLQRLYVDDTAALDLFSALLNRLYYASEKEATALCRVGLPEATLKTLSLAAVFEGKVLGEAARLSPLTEFAFSLDALPASGVFPIAIVLRDKEGKTLTEQVLKLTRRPPKPGVEWNVDLVNLNFLRNGAPYFPYGVIFAAPGGAEPENEHFFKEVADIGFDAIVQWNDHVKGNPDAAARYLKVAEKYGLNVVFHPECFARFDAETRFQPIPGTTPEDIAKLNTGFAGSSGSPVSLKGWLCGWGPSAKWSARTRGELYLQYFDRNWPRYKSAIEQVKNAPNLMGYFILDEPLVFEIDQDLVGRKFYAALNALDGYHPVFVNYSSEIPDHPRALGWCDALGTDPYWVPGGKYYPRNTVNWVAKIVDNTVLLARKYNRVPWTVPMAEYWGSIDKRPATPAEQRCQTYLALVHGTKGVFYFIHPVKTRAMYDALQRLSAEMKKLGPICLTPALAQNVLYNGKSFDTAKNQFADIQVSLKRNPEGGLVLLAVNTRECPVNGQFKLSCLKEESGVKGLFDATKFAVKDGAFEDTLEAFGVRAYALDAGAEGPVDIAVTMAPTTPETKEIALPVTGRPNAKNLLRNPSFEENSLPHWPNYYKFYTEALPPDRMLGDQPNAILSLDAKNAYHGKQALKLTSGSSFYYFMAPQVERPAAYAISMYMKANKEGTKVRVWSTSSAKYDKTFTVGETWKRYELPITMPPKADEQTFHYVSLCGKIGNYPYTNADTDRVVWIDAMQFEAGDKATTFEP